jgi:predicted aspartyl protease
MVDGFFLNLRDLPAVKAPLVFGETVSSPDFILDTGFSGDIKVDIQTANDLGIDLNDAAIIRFGNANGKLVPARLAHGFAE